MSIDTPSEAIAADRSFVNGLPLPQLRRLWRENEQLKRRCWAALELYTLSGTIDRKWQVLAPEFAKHGIGFDCRGNEVPLDSDEAVNRPKEREVPA